MRPYISVFDTTTLTFIRVDPDAGYLHEGRWVETPAAPVEATGDLQPLPSNMIRQIDLPEGLKKIGMMQFSSKGVLKTVDDVGLTSADKTTLRNRTYYVARLADWSIGSVLSTDYNTYILALQELPNEGPPPPPAPEPGDP
jgi:hypothetical protein